MSASYATLGNVALMKVPKASFIDPHRMDTVYKLTADDRLIPYHPDACVAVVN